jgi:hypothetical protein
MPWNLDALLDIDAMLLCQNGQHDNHVTDAVFDSVLLFSRNPSSKLPGFLDKLYKLGLRVTAID